MERTDPKQLESYLKERDVSKSEWWFHTFDMKSDEPAKIYFVIRLVKQYMKRSILKEEK
jgi:hypothetical protein